MRSERKADFRDSARPHRVGAIIRGQSWAEKTRQHVLISAQIPTIHDLVAMVLLCGYAIHTNQHALLFILSGCLFRAIRLLGLDAHDQPTVQTQGEVLRRETASRVVWAGYQIDLTIACLPHPIPPPATIHALSTTATITDMDQIFLEIRAKLRNPPLFIADLRPIFHPICVICSHEVAEQISRASKAFPYSPPKGDVLDHFEPFLGKSILIAEGPEWKALRKRFDPGFAPQHLISLLPEILDRVERFVDLLDGYCGVERGVCTR
ncbi:hypothetical protein BJX66DRAFT_344213 [Aspergillus keveii]|uniref:Cytochrome P450 n=1 Tax=Aspergillus keveii TaxID=714993 RepID=A0ABR4FME4_9EURO